MKERQNLPSHRYKLSPRQLEPRRLLNAEFAFAAGTGTLSLFDFTNDNAGIDQVEIEQTATTTTFTLTDGTWQGTDGGGITGNNLAILTVDTSLLNVVDFINNSGDQFDIEFGDFALAGDLNVSGATSFGEISQATGTSVDLTNLNISAADQVCLTNDNNDFTTVSFSGVSDVEPC